MEELSNAISQETRTPIEVLLQMNEAGFVSAKNLYEFLELDTTHYSRWCKDNIVDNELVDEGIDYHVQSSMVNSFSHNGENLGGRPTTDYLLTIDLAKELCMLARTPKAKQAREYFKKTEKALVVTTKQYNQLAERFEQLGKFVEDKISIIQEVQKTIEEKASSALAGVNALNSGTVTGYNREVEWINEVSVEIEKLAKHWGRHDPQLCIMWLIDELDGKDNGVQIAPYKFIEYKRKYVLDNPGTKPTRLTVIASDSQYRALFTEVLHRKLQEYDEEFDETSSLFSKMIVGLGEPEVGGKKEWEPDWNDPAFLAMCDQFEVNQRKNEEMEKAQREAMAKMNPEDFGDFDDIID